MNHDLNIWLLCEKEIGIQNHLRQFSSTFQMNIANIYRDSGYLPPYTVPSPL